MSHKDTKVMFATKEDKPKKSFEKPWRILIVDDEPEVHNVTHLILGKENFNGRNLELISAYSAEEAKKIMAREDDIAVVLLDVVMETSTAGLDAAEYIRNELGNKIVRVILRTGQPGEAPDKRVIVDYDINDYKEKSELTSNKLFTSVVAALRSYSQLRAIDRCRSKLKNIVSASAGYCKSQNIEEFSSMLLEKIDLLLTLGENSLYLHIQDGSLDVLSSYGKFSSISTEKLAEFEHKDLIDKAFSSGKSSINDYAGIFYYKSNVLGENAVLILLNEKFEKGDFELLEIFVYNTMSAFSNLLGSKKNKKEANS